MRLLRSLSRPLHRQGDCRATALTISISPGMMSVRRPSGRRAFSSSPLSQLARDLSSAMPFIPRARPPHPVSPSRLQSRMLAENRAPAQGPRKLFRRERFLPRPPENSSPSGFRFLPCAGARTSDGRRVTRRGKGPSRIDLGGLP